MLNWMSKFFRNILLAGAILYIVVYLFAVFFRIQYPFELGWMEGGSVDHVRRILSGQKLYVSPSLEFIPYNYTPLYFYISAVISSIVGIGFIPLRLVSFISSLGCFFIIFLIVKQETKSIYSGILAGGLFAATFRISGAWFDIGRVDSLFLLFLLSALYLIRFKISLTSSVLAGVLISLSFLTKQTALAVSFPMMIYCVITDWRRSIFFIGAFVAIIGGSTLFLDYIHDGWYSYYVFELPSQFSSRIISSRLLTFWSRDIISPLGIAFSMSIFYMFAQFSDSNKKKFLFYFLTAVGMFGGAWLPRIQGGGIENVLIPAYAVISILFGLALHTFFEFIKDLPVNKQNLLKIFIYLICILQFSSGHIRYNPFDQIPAQKDLEAGRKFINIMAQMKGEVFVPSHGYLPVLAGKRSFAHQKTISDNLGWGKEDIKAKLTDEIRQAIAEKRFNVIILDNNLEEPWFLTDIVEKYYVRQGQIFDSKTVFWPVVGMKTRPEFIYVPQKQ